MTEHEGPTEIAVGDQDGQVILKFSKNVSWIAIDPQIAPLIAEQMIRASSACGVRVSLQMPEREIKPNQRKALAARVELVMKNMNDRGKGRDFIAQEVVDIVLRDTK